MIMMHVKAVLEIMIRIIVMLIQILVLIYHLCGFSSAVLKSHELLTVCNLIKVKEAEAINTSWRQYFVETFISAISQLDAQRFCFTIHLLHTRGCVMQF
jgi:hypothetical protein